MLNNKETEIGWNFDNSYARLPKSFFAQLNPTPVASPKLVILNYPLAKSLGLNPEALKKEGVAILAGNKIPEGAFPCPSLCRASIWVFHHVRRRQSHTSG